MTWVQDFVKVVCPDSEPMSGDLVPEFFLPALRDSVFSVFTELEIELKRLLHVSQEYQYLKPFKGNSWVESETVISDLKEKKSKLGDMYIMDLKTKFLQNGELCAESLMRVFVRRG
jgi:hypothetical protein